MTQPLTRTPAAVHVRDARLCDLEHLSEFAGTTYRDAYSKFDDAEEINHYVAENFSHQRLTQLYAQPESQFLLAETDVNGIPQLVGYAHMRLAQPQNPINASQPLQLVRLYLQQQNKGLGIGSVLMQAVIGRARTQCCDAIWLGVYSLNRPAIAFYQRWGFEQVGMIEFVFAGRTYLDPMLALKLNG